MNSTDLLALVELYVNMKLVSDKKSPYAILSAPRTCVERMIEHYDLDIHIVSAGNFPVIVHPKPPKTDGTSADSQ